MERTKKFNEAEAFCKVLQDKKDELKKRQEAFTVMCEKDIETASFEKNAIDAFSAARS